MDIFKHQMTPEELCALTGYSPQTINKWVREKGWKTVKIEGVKGGKAHALVMDATVCRYFLMTRRMRKRYPELSRSEEPLLQWNSAQETPERQILDIIKIMSDAEKLRLADLLKREGISGFLRKLGIGDDAP